MDITNEPTTTDSVCERLDRIEYLLEQLIEQIANLSISGSGYSVEDIPDYGS